MARKLRGTQKRKTTAAQPGKGTPPGIHGIFAEAVRHHQDGRLDQAESLYRQVLEADPRHFCSLHLMGVVALTTGRPDLAVELIGKAIAVDGDVPYPHSDLGNALRDLGRLTEAEASHRRAIALKPDHAEAWNNLGNALKDLGRLDEALAAYERAIAIDPRTASAWYNRAEHKVFTADDPDVDRMEAQLGPEGPGPDNARMLLHFALGKAYLDMGRSEQAFRHLGEGNRLKRATFAYSADDNEALTKNIIKTFTPELFERFAGAGHASSLPIFVVGFPRSGTTLVEQILASHPLVRGAGELTAMQRIVACLGVYPDFVGGLTAENLDHMAAAYLSLVAPLADGRPHVVDKLPANFQFAGLIRLMLPGARIVHCRRDPVDTCLSCYTRLFSDRQLFSYDLAELGRYHRDYQLLMAHWRALLPADRFLEVDYESVVADVEKETRRMVAFLDLPWDDSCPRFHRNPRPVRTASAFQVRQPLYGTSVGRWKAHAAQLKPLLDALAQRP